MYRRCEEDHHECDTMNRLDNFAHFTFYYWKFSENCIGLTILVLVSISFCKKCTWFACRRRAISVPLLVNLNRKPFACADLYSTHERIRGGGVRVPYPPRLLGPLQIWLKWLKDCNVGRRSAGVAPEVNLRNMQGSIDFEAHYQRYKAWVYKWPHKKDLRPQNVFFFSKKRWLLRWLLRFRVSCLPS